MHIIQKYFFDAESNNRSSAEIITLLDNITKKEHKYNVVLLDDDDHTYDYVIEMLMDIFGYTVEESYLMACEVDYKGRVIVFTTSKEQAEIKREEIHNFGPDHRLSRSKGSMNAIVETAEYN